LSEPPTSGETPLPFVRDFPYPLNVFMHVITQEEGEARDLHYGLFENPGESILTAQQRSTDLVLSRLPSPPARVLDVGMGLGRTLATLGCLGYDAEGITPDEHQVALAMSRFGQDLRARVAAFESFTSPDPYDALLFQESSQYIDSNRLFDQALALVAPIGTLLVLDEFSMRPVDRPGALHRYDGFLAAGERTGFTLEEELDLSTQAAPTVDWFLARLPRHRSGLIGELALRPEQLDALQESGRSYRDLYRTRDYGYRLLRFRAPHSS
jgi:SAM-dependent methyltransferase